MNKMTLHQISLNLCKLYRFVSLLTLEPIMISYDIQSFAQTQLIQDKLCLQKYRQTSEYCRQLPKLSQLQDISGQKTAILSESTQIIMYQNIIVMILSVIVGLLIGQLIDQSRNAKRTLILAATAIIALESSLILLYSQFDWIDYRYILVIKLLQGVVGCPMAQFAVYWSYVSAVTPSHLRAVRMTCAMACMYGTIPISYSLGGHILNLEPLFSGHELRNYSIVYLISIGSSFVAFLLAFVLVNEQRDQKLYRKYFPTEEHEKEIEHDIGIMDLEQDNKRKTVSVWKIVTNLSNVVLMFRIFCKPRPHGIRMQLFLSFLAIFQYMFNTWGFLTFVYQYMEKVFDWDTKEYGAYQTMSYSVDLFTTILLAPILKIFHINDLTMSIIAFSMVTIQNLLRTLSTSVWLFRSSIFFYTLNSLAIVGFHAHISRIIPSNELGSIFSIISIFEAMAPMISSVILSTIFRATIDSCPNMAFGVMTACGSIGLILGFVVRYQSVRTLEMLQKIDDLKLTPKIETDHNLEIVKL